MLVLRITRHEPEGAQVAELKKAFGEGVQIVTLYFARVDALHVRELVETYNADALEIVAPLGMIARILTRNFPVPLLKAQWPYNPETGRADFSHYEVIEWIEVHSRPLVPPTDTKE